MQRRSVMLHAAMVLMLPGAGPALADQPPAAISAMPADPVLGARCRADLRAFGCANAANLAAMARPQDLLSGGPLAPAEGALEAAAVGRLVRDEVKDLRREGAGTQGGGGGPQ